MIKIEIANEYNCVEYKDISAHVIKKSFKFHEILHNKLKPACNSLSFTINAPEEIYKFILENKTIFVKITENTTPILNGTLRAERSGDVLTHSAKIKCECVDWQFELKNNLSHEMIYKNISIFSPDSIENCLLYKLFSPLRSKGIKKIRGNAIGPIHFFYASRKDTYEDILAKLSYEFGFIYYIKGDTIFIQRLFYNKDLNPSFIFNKTNCFRCPSWKQTEYITDYVSIKWHSLKVIKEDPVWEDTTGGNEHYKAYIEVLPGDTYPINSQNKTVWANFGSSKGDLLSVESQKLDIDMDTGLEIVSKKFESKRACFKIMNNTGSTRIIRKLRIVGTSLIKTDENYSIYPENSGTKKEEYKASFIQNENDASVLAKHIYTYKKNSLFSYMIKSPISREIGEIVSFFEHNQSRICLIVEKTKEGESFSYKLEAIGLLQNGNVKTDFSTGNPIKKNAGKDGVSGKIIYLQTATPSISARAGKYTPEILKVGAFEKIGASNPVSYYCYFKLYVNSLLFYKSTTAEKEINHILQNQTDEILVEIYKDSNFTTLIDTQLFPVISGKNGYSCFLTNTAHVFSADENGNTPIQTVETEIIAFKGLKKIPIVIDPIENVLGLRISIKDNKVGFSTRNTKTLAKNGTVSIPVRFAEENTPFLFGRNGIVFGRNNSSFGRIVRDEKAQVITLKFSYAKSEKGITGEKGDKGNKGEPGINGTNATAARYLGCFSKENIPCDVNTGDWLTCTQDFTSAGITAKAYSSWEWDGIRWIWLNPAKNINNAKLVGALPDMIEGDPSSVETGKFHVLLVKKLMSMQATIEELSSQVIKLKKNGKIESDVYTDKIGFKLLANGQAYFKGIRATGGFFENICVTGSGDFSNGLKSTEVNAPWGTLRNVDLYHKLLPFVKNNPGVLRTISGKIKGSFEDESGNTLSDNYIHDVYGFFKVKNSEKIGIASFFGDDPQNHYNQNIKRKLYYVSSKPPHVGYVEAFLII